MQFPDEWLKGIPNKKEYITDDNRLASHLFHFKPEFLRTDGWVEQSINWNDDENSITYTLSQEKNGEIHFKAGLAVLSRHELHKINKKPQVNDMISYERAPLPDNKYHGNLLLKHPHSNKTMKMIAATIAVIAFKRIIEQSPAV